MIIDSRKKLIQVIEHEKNIYFPGFSFIQIFRMGFCLYNDYYLWLYVKRLRICEYYYYKMTNNSSFIYKVLLVISRRRKNRIGHIISVDIHENVFDEGLRLFHPCIVVNSNVIGGKNCKLHGNNCIGNKGIDNSTPTIGNNVEFGFGSGAYGDVVIHDGCVIGANAVVISSSHKKGSCLVGVPAIEKR